MLWAYLLTLLTIPISVDTFDMFYYVLSLSIDFLLILFVVFFDVLSLSIDFVDYADICGHFWTVLLCFESIYWLSR